MAETIFEKIIAREVPADIVYETEALLAFRDINPQASTHILIIPKRKIERVAQAEDGDEALLGKLLLAARHVAKEEGLNDRGYRIVINNGPDGGETVPHLHVHVIGGRPLSWPPG